MGVNSADSVLIVPATIAMEKSYAALRDTGTDLHNCDGWQIKDFFEVCPLLFDDRLEWCLSEHSNSVSA